MSQGSLRVDKEGDVNDIPKSAGALDVDPFSTCAGAHKNPISLLDWHESVEYFASTNASHQGTTATTAFSKETMHGDETPTLVESFRSFDGVVHTKCDQGRITCHTASPAFESSSLAHGQRCVSDVNNLNVASISVCGQGCTCSPVYDNFSSKVNGWRTAVNCVCTVWRMDELILTGVDGKGSSVEGVIL
jgi:hypothetical protein